MLANFPKGETSSERFIGEGRTGAESLALRHGKPKPKNWFRFFVLCIERDSNEEKIALAIWRKPKQSSGLFVGEGRTGADIPRSPPQCTQLNYMFRWVFFIFLINQIQNKLLCVIIYKIVEVKNEQN